MTSQNGPLMSFSFAGPFRKVGGLFQLGMETEVPRPAYEMNLEYEDGDWLMDVGYLQHPGIQFTQLSEDGLKTNTIRNL